MSEDILERAKKALIDDDMTYEDYDECISLLIAEVEAKRNLALDMLTKNKDLLDRAMRAEAEVERLRNLPRADVAAYDRRIQEMAARIKELEAEVEAKNKQIKELQDLIDKPPEEADWMADYHLLQSALDGPIIDAARKWHAAYRKAQNSNLMRAKEVERLRSVPAWEVTEERIAAMKDACNFLVYAEIRNKGVNPGNVNRAKNTGDVLRAMLEEGKRDA